VGVGVCLFFDKTNDQIEPNRDRDSRRRPSIHHGKPWINDGLIDDVSLQTVCRLIVIAKIKLTNAFSAWWGFTSAADRQTRCIYHHHHYQVLFQATWPTHIIHTKTHKNTRKHIKHTKKILKKKIKER